MCALTDLSGVRVDLIAELEAEENARFVSERPRSMGLLERAHRSMPRGVPMVWMDDLYEHPPVVVESGEGATFTDVDGHTYLDMYIADMSAFCGHAPRPVVEAVIRRIALGNQFLLPGTDAIAVAEHLVTRYGMPYWQFTLSATQANTEVIRLARHATGREVILMFDGKYHGHGDATLVVFEDGTVLPEEQGLPRSATQQARIVQFNDLDALEHALAPRDVALVLTEPAMTNIGIVSPEPRFHEALRRLTRDTGTLLAIDETHTLVAAYGGLTTELGLKPDFLTLGKSIAAGVPLGAYAMTDELAALIAPPGEHWLVGGIPVAEVALGGTLFANALSMTAGRAALVEVLTEEAFARTTSLGAALADGIEEAVSDFGLPWSVSRLGAHAYYTFAPHPSRNAIEYRAADHPRLRALMRIWMANRGVWESGWWLGPTVSVAHTTDDVSQYLGVLRGFLAAVT